MGVRVRLAHVYWAQRVVGTSTGRETGLQSADRVFVAATAESPVAAAGLSVVGGAPTQASSPWIASAWDVLTRPLPLAGFVDRLVQRSIALLAVRQVTAVYGLENLLRAPQPFIVAVNHNIKREALLVPALLVFHRDGRWIRFLADWNFLMIPVVGWVMRRSGAIIITRKPAKPAFLNRFRPRYAEATTPAERVKAKLAAGECVGVFPEGTVNRNPRRLLVGRVGMSRLSLETGAPIIPIGIRFPAADPDRPLPEDAVMEIHIGPHLSPPSIASDRPPPIGVARRWHAAVMTEIARLSGKSWGLQSHVDDHGT
jgi:1-acyl-sn-glycerol-3-phosphate acyltransferase